MFVRIDWYDEIKVSEAEGLSLSCNDPVLADEIDNLCLQAGRLLRAHSGIMKGAEIHLEKRIPTGAGLGGGSSDAAVSLRLLNELWELGLNGDELQSLGLRLGSDVPVFLHGTPAYATGRGEVLETLIDQTNDQPFEIPFHFVVAKPDVHVATGMAYGLVTPDDDSRPDIREVVRSLDLGRWRKQLVNDFQRPVVARFPAIGEAISLLDGAGAGYTALSGSGSAVFGVFEVYENAEQAARRAEAAGLQAWSGQVYHPIRPF